MQNNKKTVIRINGEPITMREFAEFSLDVLVHCTSNGIVEDGEDMEILNFIRTVNDCLEEIAPDELTKEMFLALQATTGLALGLKTDLFWLVDGERMGDFTNTWTDLLFTDTLGSTFKETAYNLSHELCGCPHHYWYYMSK